MKIVVTGATGFVGQNLIPLLQKEGADLLLVGRQASRVLRMFPNIATCEYEELERCASGFSLLVHLAVVNNHCDQPSAVFYDVNVRQFLDVVATAKRAGITRIVNISSVHALDPQNHSPYAESKREALQRLAEVEGIATTTVFLPALYGNDWSGKLSILNKLPKPLARLLFQTLAALKPVAHVSLLAGYILPGTEAADKDKEEAILSDGQGNNLVYRSVRRIIDLSFVAAIALLFWWALALIWILVRLQSPGPGIFAQDRVGRNGEIFTCYKFRTMEVGTEQAATNEISATAVTRLGRVLRATKLDELPQIWNILRNEISLVGPRPCLPVQKELIEARRRYGVLQLKPGITGLAQVNDIDMSNPARLARWDARYLALQSLLLDLKIMIRTARGGGQGDRISQSVINPH